MADTSSSSDSNFSAHRAEMIHSNLVAGYAGRPCLSPGRALAIIDDAARDPDDAARQRLDRGTFPFPTVLVAGRRLVMLVDIAATLARAPISCNAAIARSDARAANDESAPPEPQHRRRGRPRKVSPVVVEQGTAQ